MDGYTQYTLHICILQVQPCHRFNMAKSSLN